MSEAPICAVAILETPGAFVLEGTVPAPAYPYPELRFWGGKVNEMEFTEVALARELQEELGLAVQVTENDHIWTGICANQTRTGRIVPQLFALFHVRVDSVDQLTVSPSLQARLVEVDKSGFEGNRRLTHFARQGLRKFADPSYTIEDTIRRSAA